MCYLIPKSVQLNTLISRKNSTIDIQVDTQDCDLGEDVVDLILDRGVKSGPKCWKFFEVTYWIGPHCD